MRINPFKNFYLKVGAFALALLLWVHVATNRTYEYQLSIPIRVVNIPDSLILISEPPEELPVTIRATGKQLISMIMGHPGIDISVADYEDGVYERRIEESDVLAALKHPYESFEIIIPMKLKIRLEPLVSKEVPIRAHNRVEPALGFAVMTPLQVEPESVTVTGPQSIVSKLRSLETDSTAFLNIDEPLREEIGLSLPDSLNLSVPDSTVVVTAEVEPKRQKAFLGVPITPPRTFNSKKYSIVPDTFSFVLEIPSSQIDSFSVNDFVISFKPPPIMRDSVRSAVRWLLPENVKVVGPMLDSLLIVTKR